jgi:tetratricopeptide (TPR) repeat protein
VLYKLALARYRGGAIDATLRALDRAVALDDQFAEAYYLMGVCLRDTERPEPALPALERAVVLSPGLIAAREELADLYQELGRTGDALEQLQIMAGLDRGRVERQVAVSLAHAAAGDADLAVLTLGNALERTSGQPLLYQALGRVWLDIARRRNDRVALGKAIEALGRVASNPSASSEALLLYGQALLLDGQRELAERTLQQASAREPIAPAALRTYADVAEEAEHFADARTALMQYGALVADGGDAVRMTRIAELSVRLHDEQAAVAWFGRALELTPGSVRALAGLAEAQAALNLTDAARATVERGLLLVPDNARLRAVARRLR